MTIKDAQKQLREIGVTLRKDAFGDFLVHVKGTPTETTYFTQDLDDAVATGQAMVEKAKAIEAANDPKGAFTTNALPVEKDWKALLEFGRQEIENEFNDLETALANGETPNLSLLRRLIMEYKEVIRTI